MNRLRCLVYAVLILTLSSAKQAGAKTAKLVVAADQWCPFFCKAGSDYDGFSVELLREALKKSGIDVEYVNAAFTRITIQVETGKWEIHGATDKTFTPNLLIGKEAVAKSKWVFVVKKGNRWTYQGPASLTGKVFGGVSGYVYSKELMDYYTQPQNQRRMLSLAGDTAQKQMLMMLMSGRIDFLVEDESVIRYWAQKIGVEAGIDIVGVDSETAFYPGYRINNKAAAILAEKVDRGLRAVKENSEIMNRLQSKYQIAGAR